MAKLEILEFPDPRLRTVASPVEVVDQEIKTLTENMLETMYEAPGIGLAATQVNVHKQVVVVDISEEQNEPYILINPEIEILSGEIDYDEGCLSIPGFYETVTRSEHIRVKALDKNGEALDFEAKDLLAICIQHEVDHLKGKLFVDYISNLKRNRIKSKLEKAHKRAAKQS